MVIERMNELLEAEDDRLTAAFDRPTMPVSYIFSQPRSASTLFTQVVFSCYRIGYATSDDGIAWTRRDDEAGIDVSEDGWDSLMVAYPHVVEHESRRYMLYNGNGFGASGFGWAEWSG